MQRWWWKGAYRKKLRWVTLGQEGAKISQKICYALLECSLNDRAILIVIFFPFYLSGVNIVFKKRDFKNSRVWTSPRMSANLWDLPVSTGDLLTNEECMLLLDTDIDIFDKSGMFHSSYYQLVGSDLCWLQLTIVIIVCSLFSRNIRIVPYKSGIKSTMYRSLDCKKWSIK